MRTLLAADLDRTLIFSRRSAAYEGAPKDLLCVEHKNGVPISYMLRTAAAQLAQLSEQSLFVPITSRTTEQFRRVAVPHLRHDHAITANGAEILVAGLSCPEWAMRMASASSGTMPLAEVRSRLGGLLEHPWVKSSKDAQGHFLCVVTDPTQTPNSFAPDVTHLMAGTGWRVTRHDRKLYVVPEHLTKQAALAEVVHRTQPGLVLAAGDSPLDLGMLRFADRAICPAHCYLTDEELSSVAPTMTQGVGARAGAEIVEWLRDNARD